MDLQVRTWEFGSRDYSWLGSKHATDAAKTATVLVSACDEDTHYPDGYIKSGTPLAKFTTGVNTGLWAPWVEDASNGLQTMTGVVLDGFDITRNAGTGLVDSTRVIGSVLLANTGVLVVVNRLPGMLLDDGTTANVVSAANMSTAGFVPLDLS